MTSPVATGFGRVRRDPLALPAAAAALRASGLVFAAALVGALVRLLPWVLDPKIEPAVIAPFAKSLLVLALEAALMTGWPVGWALAVHRLVERGEGRVLAALGERPRETLARLLPQGAVLAAALIASSLVLGRDAAAPGRVVNAVLEQGRAACAPGTTQTVPLVSATWLCPREADAAASPRLVGRAPFGGAVFTAEAATVSGDLRRIDLLDARVLLPAEPSPLRVRVARLSLRGLSPWARASAVPPALRAAVVTASSALSACAAAVVLLGARRRRAGSVAAAALGAAGPLAALATLRALELRLPDAPGAWLASFVLVPASALLAVAAAGALARALPESRGAGNK